MPLSRELSQLASVITVKDSNKHVGIGSTAPTSEFDVAGNIKATSFFGDGSNLTGITAEGTGAIGGLTIKDQSGSVVGTGGSISTIDFNGSSGVTVSASSGPSGIATVQISAPNLSNYATLSYVNQEVAGIVSAAPSTLDTLNELAAALNDDANFSTTVTNQIAQKANISGAQFTGIVTATQLTLTDTSTANRKAVEGSWTASAGQLANIDNIGNINFKTIEYTLHIENSAGVQAQKVLVTKSGSTPYSQEYAIMYSSDLLVSIGSSNVGGSYYLNATPETGITGSTTYNFVREIMS